MVAHIFTMAHHFPSIAALPVSKQLYRQHHHSPLQVIQFSVRNRLINKPKNGNPPLDAELPHERQIRRALTIIIIPVVSNREAL